MLQLSPLPPSGLMRMTTSLLAGYSQMDRQLQSHYSTRKTEHLNKKNVAEPEVAPVIGIYRELCGTVELQ